MRKKAFASTFAAILLGGLFTTATPNVASAESYNRDHHVYAQNERREARAERRAYQERQCRRAATRGTAIGALGGGLVGNLASNHGLGGTLIGAGVGAVAGHEISKSNCRRR